MLVGLSCLFGCLFVCLFVCLFISLFVVVVAVTVAVALAAVAAAGVAVALDMLWTHGRLRIRFTLDPLHAIWFSSAFPRGK